MARKRRPRDVVAHWKELASQGASGLRMHRNRPLVPFAGGPLCVLAGQPILNCLFVFSHLCMIIQCKKRQQEQYDLNVHGLEHRFCCEREPTKQAFITREHHPETLFSDIKNLNDARVQDVNTRELKVLEDIRTFRRWVFVSRSHEAEQFAHCGSSSKNSWQFWRHLACLQRLHHRQAAMLFVVRVEMRCVIRL